MDNENICRTCGEITRSSNARDLFEDSEAELLQHINLLTGLWLVYQEYMPVLICAYCQQDLKQAFTFRKRCIAIQMELEENLQHEEADDTQDEKQPKDSILIKCTKTNKIKMNDISTDPVEQDPLIVAKDSSIPSTQDVIEDYVSDEDDDDTHEYMYQVNSTLESGEETIVPQIQEEKCDSNSNNPYDNDSYISDVEVDDQEPFIWAVKEEKDDQDAVPPISNTQTFIKIEPLLNLKYKPCGLRQTPKNRDLNESKSKRPYRFINRKPRSTEPKKYKPTRSEYICEKCGKRYATLFTFSEHKLYHTGVKNFKCGECGMLFMTRRLLTHHSRRHTDERPYSCRICERTFRSRAHRNAHEKRHEHPTPYSCSICSKSYTTAYHRDLHQADHNGVRKYHCEICERSFMTRKHLATHKKSKFHTQNKDKFDEIASFEKADAEIGESN